MTSGLEARWIGGMEGLLYGVEISLQKVPLLTEKKTAEKMLKHLHSVPHENEIKRRRAMLNHIVIFCRGIQLEHGHGL